LQILDETYDSGGPWRVTLAPDEEMEQSFDLSASGAWYDFSVTDGAAPAYLRRFAGRIESGLHGISDPALGTG
jgi:phospholipase C